MHDIIIVESSSVSDILFAGKRVSASYQGGEEMPEDFGTAQGVMKSGLADLVLANRTELKETVTKLSTIILKKGELLEEQSEISKNSNDSISTALQKTSEAV